MPKALKTSLKILAVLLVVILALGFVAGNIAYTIALTPGSDKSFAYQYIEDIAHFDYDAVEDGDAWLATHPHEDIWVEGYKGTQLHGYLLYNETAPQEAGAPGHRWAIACHGYTSDAKSMVGAGSGLARRGFNVLLPDARASGQSQGDYYGLGWHDRLDLVAWINRIVEMDPEAEILLYGISMGGAEVMMAAGEELPPNVKAVIEDCGYASINEVVRYQMGEMFGLPSFPLLQFTSAVTWLRAGYTLGQVDTLAQLEKSSLPILFIHGGSDTFVPTSEVYRLYDAAGGEKELLVVEGASHGASSQVDNALYWGTIDNFVDKYFT